MNTFIRRLLAVPLLLVLIGQGCNAGIKAPPASAKPFTLTVWRVLDDEDSMTETIEAYHALHPNITIVYKKFRLEEYEKELLNALAEDRGPDVLMIHNTWIRAYEPKLLPMPAQVKLAFKEIQGTVQKTEVWVERTKTAMTVAQLKNLFVDQVYDDVVISAPVADPKRGLVPQIFGLPLALDTMALYFNRDVLNANGIPNPAASWTEFQDHVKRSTKYDDQGRLVRPAAGIGAAKNVDRAFDLLSVLMMQNGTEMTDANGLPTFHRTPETGEEREFPPGLEALVFYTDFANPAKEVFTWDDTQPNSYDAFTAGRTAYFFGYSYHMARIRAQAPRLNFGVTTLPQIDPNFRRNYANYWVETVSKKTKQPDAAWDFVQFAASEAQAKTYLAKTAKPTALRSLINAQLNDGDLAPFAEQVLTAKSWYKGTNTTAAETAFTEMIEAVLAGTDPLQAIRFAVDTIAQTVR